MFSAVWAVSEEVDCVDVIHSTSRDTDKKYDIRRVRNISSDLRSHYDTNYGENFHCPVQNVEKTHLKCSLLRIFLESSEEFETCGNKKRTHEKYWSLRTFPNLFIILICVPRFSKWSVPRVFNEDLVRSSQVSTVHQNMTRMAIVIYIMYIVLIALTDTLASKWRHVYEVYQRTITV
jgi:hypothetical protein